MDNRLEIILAAKNITGKAFATVQEQVTGLSKAVFSLNGVMVAAAGAAGMGLVIQKSLEATAEIQRNAKMAGVGVEAYQELTYAGSKYGVTIDSLTDGMKELSLRGDEFAKTGVGPAAEAFERLGYSAEDVNARLADTPGFLSDIISRMEGLETAAQIRIADELFGGTGGEQFVAMIQAGAQSFEDLRNEAHALGLVIDEALVQESVEAKREVEKLTKVLGTNFNSVVAALAPDIADAAESMAGWVKENQTFLTQNIPGHVTRISEAIKTFVTSDYAKMFMKIMTFGGGAGLASVIGELNELNKSLPKTGSEKRKAELEHEYNQLKILAQHPDQYSVTQNDVLKAMQRLNDFKKQQWFSVDRNTSAQARSTKYPEKPTPEPDHLSESARIAAETRAQFFRQEHEARYNLQKELHKKLHTLTGNENYIALQVQKEQNENEAAAMRAFNEQKAADWRAAHEKMYADMKRMSDLSGLAVYEYGEKAIKVSEDITTEWSNAFAGWANSYSSTLNNMLWESELSFSKIAESFGKMVTQMVIQQKLIQPFTNWIGGGIDSIGSWIGGFFHDGGIVGSEGSRKAVSPFLFAGAPKFHHGLMPDEFPAILQRGEGVFTAEQMKALGTSNKTPSFSVKVINNTGTNAEVEKKAPRFDGEKWVCEVVLNKIARSRSYKQNFNGALGRI